LRAIVLTKPASEHEVIGRLQNTLDTSIGPPGTENLSLISGFAIVATSDELQRFSDAEPVTAIWQIPEEIYNVYVRIIKSLEDLVISSSNAPGVANISLAPPRQVLSPEFDPAEPIHIATRAAAENNQVVVFAAGNYGPANNMLNPWSVAPWVISVGAASKDGTRLADFSSRGIPANPIYRPTVVAPGVDVIGAHVKGVRKTAKQKEDEKRIGFKKIVPWRRRRWYSVNSGTSFATPEVSRIVLQIIHFLGKMRESTELAKGGPLPANATFAQIYTHDQNAKRDDRVTTNRLIGKLDVFGSASTASYPIAASPTVVKQIILDMAIVMPDYQPHEVGAGFVSRELAEHYFGAYGIVDPAVTSYKVL